MKANEFIAELFSPTSAFQLEWDDDFGPREIHATAYDREGRVINIDFVPTSDMSVELEFSRGGSTAVTGRGDAVAVFATVLEAIKRYLQGYQPKFLVFSAKEPSRAKLYQSLAAKMGPMFGYNVIDHNKLPEDVKIDLSLDIVGSSTPFVLMKD